MISDLFFVFNSLTQIPVGPYTLGDVEGLLIKAEGINTPASFVKCFTTRKEKRSRRIIQYKI